MCDFTPFCWFDALSIKVVTLLVCFHKSRNFVSLLCSCFYVILLLCYHLHRFVLASTHGTMKWDSEIKTKVLFRINYPDFIYCWDPRPGATSFYLYKLRNSAPCIELENNCSSQILNFSALFQFGSVQIYLLFRCYCLLSLLFLCHLHCFFLFNLFFFACPMACPSLTNE